MFKIYIILQTNLNEHVYDIFLTETWRSGNFASWLRDPSAASPVCLWGWDWCSPAVDDHRAGAGWTLGFDPADEAQQPRGVIRDAVIRPAGEVKLTDLPDLMSSSLETTHTHTHTHTHSTFKDTASESTDDQKKLINNNKKNNIYILYNLKINTTQIYLKLNYNLKFLSRLFIYIYLKIKTKVIFKIYNFL